MITRTTLIALALTIGATPAAAADSHTPRSATVRIDDLNLRSQQDQHKLDTRVKSAIRNICRADIGGLSAKAEEARCIRNAQNDAQPRAAKAVAQAGGRTQLALLMVEATR